MTGLLIAVIVGLAAAVSILSEMLRRANTELKVFRSRYTVKAASSLMRMFRAIHQLHPGAFYGISNDQPYENIVTQWADAAEGLVQRLQSEQNCVVGEAFDRIAAAVNSPSETPFVKLRTALCLRPPTCRCKDRKVVRGDGDPKPWFESPEVPVDVTPQPGDIIDWGDGPRAVGPHVVGTEKA